MIIYGYIIKPFKSSDFFHLLILKPGLEITKNIFLSSETVSMNKLYKLWELCNRIKKSINL